MIFSVRLTVSGTEPGGIGVPATSTLSKSSTGGINTTTTGSSTSTIPAGSAIFADSGSRDSNRKPTGSEVFEALFRLYQEPQIVARLMCLFTDLAEDFYLARGGDRWTLRDTRGEIERRDLKGYGYTAVIGISDEEKELHALLERVMPDLATAKPESVHDMINRHFLPPGYVFMHDNAKGCLVAVI